MTKVFAGRQGRQAVVVTWQILTLLAGIPAAAWGRAALEVAAGATIHFAAPWRESQERFRNAHEIVRPAGTGRRGDLWARLIAVPEAQPSHAAALARLAAIAGSHKTAARASAVGGWPAVETEFSEPLVLPDEGRDQADDDAAPIARRATIAVAFDNVLLQFDAWVVQEAPPQVLQQAEQIARNCRFTHQAAPDALRRDLQSLTLALAPQPPKGAGAAAGPAAGSAHAPGGAAGRSGAPPKAVIRRAATLQAPTLVSATPLGGELEIAASSGADRVVVAINRALAFSSDGGNSFSAAKAGAIIGAPNDPTLTRSSSRFYLGSIATTPTACVNAVASSPTTDGSTFTPAGLSAVCSPIGLCFPDQPHLAADAHAQPGSDQVYAVWRQDSPFSAFTACSKATAGRIVPLLSCSRDSGATWSTPPVLVTNGGDFPRVTVAADGTVYVVTTTTDGTAILLNRYSSCAGGLAPLFAVTAATLSQPFACPVPGLDRCTGGNLASPTLAADPDTDGHLFLTFAESDGAGGERIVSLESVDAGANFNTRWELSGSNTGARRFMPWGCSTLGTVVAGWYDRSAATAANNDLTDYLAGSPAFAAPVNLTGASDPQCAQRWPCQERSSQDWQSCSVQPQNAGLCVNSATGKGAGPCNFDATSCTAPGFTCVAGTGCPKYGDYNGATCEDGRLIAAWASATPPAGLSENTPAPPPNAIDVFAAQLDLRKFGPPSFDRMEVTLTTGNDDAGDGLEIAATVAGQTLPLCLKPSTGALTPPGRCSDGPGAADQHGLDTWINWNVSQQVFALDTPQTSAAAFKTFTITARQAGCDLSCDNWDIQGLRVRVFDSADIDPDTHAVVLADISNPRAGDPDNCLARLKAPPNATTVAFGLDPANPSGVSHVYTDGTGTEMMQPATTCKNNGDGG
jgi:hypothetical protein